MQKADRTVKEKLNEGGGGEQCTRASVQKKDRQGARETDVGRGRFYRAEKCL